MKIQLYYIDIFPTFFFQNISIL